MQRISWYRRVHALAALGNIKSAKETLKEESAGHLKLMKGQRQNLVNHFKPSEEKKKKDATKTHCRLGSL